MLTNMDSSNHFWPALLLCMACTGGMSMCWAASSVPDERDRQVLEVLIERLHADSGFDRTRVSSKATAFLLHARTPESGYEVGSEQLQLYIDNHKIPEDLERELRHRNTPPDAKFGSDGAIAAWFTNLSFGPRVVIADLTGKMGDRFFSRAFRDAYPNARGWMQSFLPGYSPDGSRALVRGWVGPSYHGAMVTAVLVKKGNRWKVKWHYIAWFA